MKIMMWKFDLNNFENAFNEWVSEMVDWLKLLLSDDIPDEILKNADSSKAIPPLYGALLKNEQDVQLLERLAFMTRREVNN